MVPGKVKPRASICQLYCPPPSGGEGGGPAASKWLTGRGAAAQQRSRRNRWGRPRGCCASALSSGLLRGRSKFGAQSDFGFGMDGFRAGLEAELGQRNGLARLQVLGASPFLNSRNSRLTFREIRQLRPGGGFRHRAIHRHRTPRGDWRGFAQPEWNLSASCRRRIQEFPTHDQNSCATQSTGRKTYR